MEALKWNGSNEGLLRVKKGKNCSCDSPVPFKKPEFEPLFCKRKNREKTTARGYILGSSGLVGVATVKVIDVPIND